MDTDPSSFWSYSFFRHPDFDGPRFDDNQARRYFDPTVPYIDTNRTTDTGDDASEECLDFWLCETDDVDYDNILDVFYDIM